MTRLDTQSQVRYHTRGGVRVLRRASALDYATAMTDLAQSLNSQRGLLLASSFEYPGRYTRWDIGFINPPIQLEGRGRQLEITALNQRGEILLPEFNAALAHVDSLQITRQSASCLTVTIEQAITIPAEEQRSRQPSVFTALRAIVDWFASPSDRNLGLYGAFGYDLTFQFEDVERTQQRDEESRDLLLYLPDRLLIADHKAEQALAFDYDFHCRSQAPGKKLETTGGLKRKGQVSHYKPASSCAGSGDHAAGEYARQVERAREYFQRGDLFEVVPGQSFFEVCSDSPAAVFHRLKQANPAPYGALINLGKQEYLVAASPEMFVRVEGNQIETCPISGTIKRGEDAIGDAEQIRDLLNSAKDESELSMCTDVDRNDKARVCEPGSVEVVGRRQIEMYSRLIHTVDHVKGQLLPQFDALDGFLAHTWAVTVTGAPKLAAMQYLERYEKSARHWYGGAMGVINFNGDMNTGLTLRTMRIKDGVAEVRAGATLLADSDPEAEERETRLKASALLAAIRGEQSVAMATRATFESAAGQGRRILMVDHQDSFVHNLASYFRQCGAELVTHRAAQARELLQSERFDLVVLSPGPGRPEQFGLDKTIAAAMASSIPIFGVCLGLQGIVEYFGGSLEQLPVPMHGKPSQIHHDRSGLFADIEQGFTAGRYHSLVAQQVSGDLRVTAKTDEGVVMAIAHRTQPIAAVQFHPESIMTLGGAAGHRLVTNAIGLLCTQQLSKTDAA